MDRFPDAEVFDKLVAGGRVDSSDSTHPETSHRASLSPSFAGTKEALTVPEISETSEEWILRQARTGPGVDPQRGARGAGWAPESHVGRHEKDRACSTQDCRATSARRGTVAHWQELEAP